MAPASAPAARTAQELWAEGEARMRADDHAGAIPLLSRALQLDPEYLEAWISIGFARIASKDPARAREDLARAIELGPDDPRGWLGRGAARALLGDYQGGIEDTEHAIRLAPQANFVAQAEQTIAQCRARLPQPLPDLAGREIVLEPGAELKPGASLKGTVAGTGESVKVEILARDDQGQVQDEQVRAQLRALAGREVIYEEAGILARARVEQVTADDWGLKLQVRCLEHYGQPFPEELTELSAIWSILLLEQDRISAQYTDWTIFQDPERVQAALEAARGTEDRTARRRAVLGALGR